MTMMMEILITSSALILALLVIRRAFKSVLSRRIQYALWGLVLLRLLVPFSLLPASDFSVLTAAAPVQQAAEWQFNAQLYYSRPVERISPEELMTQNISLSQVPTAEEGSAMILMEPPAPGSDISLQQRGYLVRDAETNDVTLYEHMAVGPWEILSTVWKVGMVLMGGFFLLSNGAFYMRLRKNREEWQAEGGLPHGERLDKETSRNWAGSALPPHPSFAAQMPPSPQGEGFFRNRKVYLVPEGAIPSPCLFGTSIYITPAVAGDPVKLRHVLCHEETHARHWDPLWSLLRCLCLTIYWFDPLVWIAARCSRTDCELACDESVLEALGEEERLPYGKTLLSLIPVKKVSNPMIAATTMTAGKRQLRDRVSRIAKQPRQLFAAALAVAMLAVIVSACTFTGGMREPTPAPSPSQVADENVLRSLTGEELRWFNEEFFNHNSNPAISYTYTIRNQFINSAFNLYDKPEDIDLYELFYCDGEVYDDSENDVCPSYKMTAEKMDDILREYTGLNLAQTNMVGLDKFTYEDGVYYWAHGDTNYPGDIEILYGTREGSTVRLYHHGWNSGSDWYCTTLEDWADEDIGPYGAEEGKSPYWFVSNQACEKPVIPTPLPAWEPEKTVSLTDLKPYTAPAVTVEPHVGDFDNSYENRLENWDIDGHNVVVYRSTDGHIYAAIRQEDDTMNVFLTLPSDDCSLFFYNDLLGHSGFYIKYVGSAPVNGGIDSGYGTIYEYFYLDEGSVPVRLLRNPSSGSAQIDLNGDGQDELLGSGGFFFQREGQIYQAVFTQPDSLWPGQIENVSLDPYGKYFTVQGYTEDYKEWSRHLYFDGENLLIYKNEVTATDHVTDGAADGVPDIVVEKAKEAALSALVEVDGIYRDAHYREEGYPQEAYDDWRVSGFYGPYVNTLGGVTIQSWSFGIRFHTIEPEKVVLAGSRSLSEDDWTSPGPWDTPNVIFLRQEEDGSLTYLWTGFDDGTLDSYGGTERLLREMEGHGVELAEGYTYPELLFQMRLEWVCNSYYDYQKSESSEMRIQYDDGRENGGTYTVDPSAGNGPYYLNQMKDNYVVWSRAEGEVTAPEGPCVTFSDPYWYNVLQFWKDSGLVMYKQQNTEPEWYEVRYDGDPAQDVYAYRAYPYYWARCWFDEAEQESWEERLLSFPDDGQDHRGIAQMWAQIYEGIKARLTPGGSMTCTYVKVENVEILKGISETWFPADIVDYPHFAFSYDVVFVPENPDALNTLMAGNTGKYTGSDPDVPEGAFQYSRRGSMYLMDGHWHCAGVGTG